MPNVEQIVRPSQTDNIRPSYPTIALAVPIVPTDDEVVWGASGNDVFALQQSLKSEVNNQDSQEIQRTFDTVRVKSPDDPNTYLDVEVITAYQARNTIDKSRTTIRFESPQASENVEVIRRNQTRNSPDPGG